MQDFRKLKVWEESHKLTLEVYEISKIFPKDELYGLVSQLRRATSSIPLNLAEGSGRFTDADKTRFYQIAFGSLHETHYCLILAKDLKYIESEKFTELEVIIEKVKAMMIKLIQKIREDMKRLNA
jgi:four helix bundle protein